MGGTAQRLHDGAVAAVGVFGAKHGAASDTGVGTGGHDVADVVGLDTAIDFEPDRLAASGQMRINPGAHQAQLGQR